MTAAAIARIVSSMPTAGRPAAGAGARRGAAGVERAAATGAAGAAVAARGALVARAGAAAGAAAAAVAEGPPGGKVGSLIVGAAEGLGGKLMRTVSFLGWTFPVSFFGGTAPVGMLGIFSAIKYMWSQTRIAAPGCQTLIPAASQIYASARASPAARRSPLQRGARSSRGRATLTVKERP